MNKQDLSILRSYFMQFVHRTQK